MAVLKRVDRSGGMRDIETNHQMKLRAFLPVVVFFILLTLRAGATTFYVDASNTVPVSPYGTWSTAATNIQDAIDASANGDTILVTNGIYQFGGTVMAGNLTNRVALNKPVTVQSMNGPWLTAIWGVGATNGNSAVRCAWLTNGAALVGFTLTRGATRNSGDQNSLESGGGVWCASSNSLVSNCLIVSNTAYQYGGGAYQGTVNSSLISSNASQFSGGADYKSVLNNCTIVSNTAVGVLNPVAMTNCIIYYNTFPNVSGSGNTISHCCVTPTLTGPGNFTTAPQLFVDGVHLVIGSPCIGAGISAVAGTDVFGNAWSSPPSVGCAEWLASPIVTQPQLQLTGSPVGFTVGNVAYSGQFPFAFYWIKDGVPLADNGHFSATQTSNLVAAGVSFADAGNYQLVVSNTVGVVTSSVAPLVIHCADIAGTNPVAPYLSWATAATNIHDAITAAAVNDVVLVNNGVYATGGISMDGVITNRVSVNKAILVQSVNGPSATIVQGGWDPTSTNGPGAVRCAWLTTNAILNGFTLFNGATRSVTGLPNQSMEGGGVFGASTNAAACNCLILTNYASNIGGGAFQTTLSQCTLTGNHAVGSGGSAGSGTGPLGSGGGADNCILKNCLLTFNSADQSYGGGAQNCLLTNCALVGNKSVGYGSAANLGRLVNCTVTSNLFSPVNPYAGGGAVANATLNNCIVYGNLNSLNSTSQTNYSGGTINYSDTDPLPSGTGNMDVNPQLLGDGVHLAATSPCIGAGTASVVSGTDIDGQPWNNPPSIGCDEWQPTPLICAQPNFQINSPAHGLTFNLVVAGQAPFACLWSKDGTLVQDDGHHSNSSTINLVVNNFNPDDAGIYQVVVSNAFGVVTSAVAQVVIHAVNLAGSNPVAPYATWATAATNIQDAINSAAVGDIVLVTNGVYATGGKAMSGGLTNRVALNRAVTVMSVNGYSATVIQGTWDPIATNGPGSVRCAYVANGATLIGFTLCNGATLATGDGFQGGPLESGGGVLCSSLDGTVPNGVVANCVLSNNCAVFGGGIAYGALNNSLVTMNVAMLGNTGFGGGAYNATLNNCTVVNNYTTTPFSTFSSYHGAGTYGGLARNSIVVNNYDSYPIFLVIQDNGSSIYGPPQYVYSYTSISTSLSGAGNINVAQAYANPQLVDSFHIATTSPCFGAGSALYASGTDLDGEPWANPPSMGCDEVVPANLVGPLTVNILPYQTNVLVNGFTSFTGVFTGRAAGITWTFGDGSSITNIPVVGHQWTNAGIYTVTFTAFNNDNPAGVSTNLTMFVQPLAVPQLQAPVLTNGFHFQFAAQTNATYIIQYTTNLMSSTAWQTLQTIYYSSGGVLQINDPNTTNGMRFYRVLVQ
jgi:hypothetical protein